MKNIIKLALKFGFAFALIYWLIQSGKLNLSLLGEIFNYPGRLTLTFLGTVGVILLVALRFKLLIEHKSSFKIPFINIIKYNWIGMFFNAVLPGSVSGDLVKIFYIKQEDEKLSNQFLLGSILIDRVVGLFGLIIVLGVFTAINYAQLSSFSNELKNLLELNLLLFLGVIFSLLSLFFFPSIPEKIAAPLKNLPLFDKIVPKAVSTWKSLCEFRHRMLILTAVSIVIQSSAIFLFWYVVSPFAQGGDFPFHHAVSLIPIGLISIAIPIAPSGMGVGHAVFDTLFGYVGVTNGADLFNIYFILVLAVNLIGAIPYLLANKTKKLDMQKVEQMNA
jgi:uncharacterized protein (TIRG00374 family)